MRALSLPAQDWTSTIMTVTSGKNCQLLFFYVMTRQASEQTPVKTDDRQDFFFIKGFYYKSLGGFDKKKVM